VGVGEIELCGADAGVVGVDGGGGSLGGGTCLRDLLLGDVATLEKTRESLRIPPGLHRLRLIMLASGATLSVDAVYEGAFDLAAS
jgi:hypothetical protein